MCEMELAGQNETCTSMLTVPPNYLDASSTRPLGIVLGHGADADDWKGEFLSRIAVTFAKKGYVVMRYYCKQKEQRRQRIYEKALDTAATSPFARGVKAWVLAGFDNGARIAAQVGSKCRGSVAGFILLSYPLLDPCPPPPKQKVGALPPPDSKGPLLKLAKPMLFIIGEFDAVCPAGDLKALAQEMAEVDMRAVVLPDLDGGFLTATERQGVGQPAAEAILGHMQTFLTALEAPGGLAACPLPRAADIVPTDRQPPTPMRKAAEEKRAAAEAAAAEAAAAAAEAAAAEPPAAPLAARVPAAAPLRGAPGQQQLQRPVVPGGFPGGVVGAARPPQGLQVPPGLMNNPGAIQQLQLLMMQQQMLVMQQQQQQHARGVAASQPLGAMPARPSLPLPAPGAAAPPQQQQQQLAFGGVPLAALQQHAEQVEQAAAGVHIVGAAPGGHPPAAQPSAMDVDAQQGLQPPQ
ncbi:hypothetical protein N2152v2_004332 [Parachlorella kessleri]